MKELTKKVVILNNFSSPYVSQAIIILKDYNPKLESRAAVADFRHGCVHQGNRRLRYFRRAGAV